MSDDHGPHPYRAGGEPLTLRLDRWASILRNSSDAEGADDLTLIGDERVDLSNVLTDSATAIILVERSRVGRPVGLVLVAATARRLAAEAERREAELARIGGRR